MKKKKIIKYALRFIPFIAGLGLFMYENITLLSSLLLFGGGYIVLKNTLDYRIVKKNIQDIKGPIYKSSYDDKPLISKKRMNCRVRKRVK